MTVFELAAELGKALKEDEKLVRLAEAKKAYEGDNVIKKYMIDPYYDENGNPRVAESN